MNVLDRLNAQINQSIQRPPAQESFQKENLRKILSKPLSLDILRKVLMESPENKIESEALEPLISEPIDVVFNGIEDFVAWYETRVDKFTDSQNMAFSTLIQARDMINPGCGCKRKQRFLDANNYFVVFWTQNATTDLPKKLMEVANAKTVRFTANGSEFLKF